jgi:hypothetical protein
MNPLLRLENEHAFLNYEPDMKDPRDFVYRKGDYSFSFTYEPTFSAEISDSQQFFGSIFLITQYIKSYDNKLYRLLGEHLDIIPIIIVLFSGFSKNISLHVVYV